MTGGANRWDKGSTRAEGAQVSGSVRRDGSRRRPSDTGLLAFCPVSGARWPVLTVPQTRVHPCHATISMCRTPGALLLNLPLAISLQASLRTAHTAVHTISSSNVCFL